MKICSLPSFPLTALSLLACVAVSPGAEFMAEGFDSEASAHIGLNNGTAVTISYVDYSSMVIGTVTHQIPEAPRRVAGSAPQKGVLMKIEYLVAGVASSTNDRLANLVALDDAGGSRLLLTDNYRMKFDAYLRVSPAVTLNASGVPTQTGTTEQLLWGVGYQATQPMGRNWRTGRGSGVWGYLATEGGHPSTATGGDAGLWVGASSTATLSRHLETTADRTAFFTPAFGSDAAPVPNCPANQWVQVDVTVSGGQVTTEFGAVGRTKTKIFENVAGGVVAGGAMIGYEDSYASPSFAPDEQWLLVDNMVLEDITPPTLTVNASATLPLRSFTGTPVVASYDLQNLRTTGDLTVSAVTFTGTDAGAFSLQTPLPLVVAPSTTQPLQVVFNPLAPNGVKAATMTITSNDPQTPSYTVTLRARRTVGSFLEAHYKLDEASGTALTDASGNGSTASLQVREPVLFGQPTLLGGTDTGTGLGFLPAQSSTTGNYFNSAVVHTPTFSISMWIKPASTGAQRTLWQRDYDSLSPYDKICGLHLLNDGSFAWRVRANTIIPAAGDPPLPTIVDGEIHHVVLTHLDEDGFGNDTATRSRLYLDGVKIAEKTGTDTKGFDDYPLSPVTSGLQVASRTIAGYGYSGDMDDVQVYGAELTKEQVWQLYKAAGTTAVKDWAIVNTQKGADFKVTCPTAPGGTYKLFRSANLQTWTQVGDPVAGVAGSLTSVLVDAAPPAGVQYYRVSRE